MGWKCVFFRKFIRNLLKTNYYIPDLSRRQFLNVVCCSAQLENSKTKKKFIAHYKSRSLDNNILNFEHFLSRYNYYFVCSVKLTICKKDYRNKGEAITMFFWVSFYGHIFLSNILITNPWQWKQKNSIKYYVGLALDVMANMWCIMKLIFHVFYIACVLVKNKY